MLALDRPIKTSSHDRLGYRHFAEAVAKAIFAQPLGEALVMAIDGTWGSGKTSAALLAIDHLRKLERTLPDEERTVVIDFQPWLFTGQPNLVSEFFSAIAPQLKKALGQKIFDAVVNVKNAAVRNSESAFTGLGTLALAVGEPATATAAATARKILKKKADSEIVGLTKRRDELKALLKKQKRRILVLIDDIDRLRPDEMQLMLGMLKSVADFPSVVYLLPVEMSVITAATALGSEDASFFEKIVQVNLNLPSPSRDGLDDLLSKAISEISQGAYLDRDDLQTAGYYIFNAYIKTPRNINQLCNALRVSWSVLAEEVYFPDLLCVEALRIFEPRVYKRVRSSRSEMLSAGKGHAKDVPIREELFQLLQNKDNTNAKGLLRHMFPVIGGIVSRGTGIGSLAGRRLSDEAGYDLYFRWSMDPDIASVSELTEFEDLLRRDGDARGLIEKLSKRRSARGTSATNSLLDAIIDGRVVGAPNAEGAIVSLLAKYLLIVDERNDTDFLLNARRRLDAALVQLLKRVSESTRPKVISKIIERRDVSLDAGASLIGAFLYTKDESIISKSESAKIVAQWVSKKIGNTLALRSAISPAGIVWKVSDSLGNDDARALIAPHLADRAFVERLALDLMSRVQSSTKPRPYLELTRLPDEDIFDLKKIQQTLSLAGHKPDKKSDIGSFLLVVSEYLEKGKRPRNE